MGQFRLRPHWGSCMCTITLQSFLPRSKKNIEPSLYNTYIHHLLISIVLSNVEKSCPSFPVQDGGLSTGMLITQSELRRQNCWEWCSIAQYIIMSRVYMYINYVYYVLYIYNIYVALIWFSNTFYMARTVLCLFLAEWPGLLCKSCLAKSWIGQENVFTGFCQSWSIWKSQNLEIHTCEDCNISHSGGVTWESPSFLEADRTGNGSAPSSAISWASMQGMKAPKSEIRRCPFNLILLGEHIISWLYPNLSSFV